MAVAYCVHHPRCSIPRPRSSMPAPTAVKVCRWRILHECVSSNNFQRKGLIKMVTLSIILAVRILLVASGTIRAP